MTTLNETAGLFVGCYPLGRLLGRGGMADVYASIHPRTGAPVAVKVFRGASFGTTDRRSAEVRTLTDLRHPNLVELLDAGTQDGCEFLVMTLVEGPTLGQACRQRLPLTRTAQIGAAVADALAYVHAGDVVHRDVKPDNVLLGPGPRVRLADFGIARMISATRITQSGLLVGTAGYLAPEQITGDDVAAPADVYALGLVLLECLTGRQEYPGTAFESAFARLYRRPQLPADLPAGWAALLDAMTADDPAARPSAVSAAGALHQLAAVPETDVPALREAMGFALAVPAAPALPAPAAPAVAAAVPASRQPVAGDEGGSAGRQLRRWLPLTAGILVVLTPAGIAGERVLRSVGSTQRSTADPHRAAGAPSLRPVPPPAPAQTVDALRRGQDATQWRAAGSSQPPTLTAVGSGGSTSSATGAAVGAVSPPVAPSTPVPDGAGPAGGGGNGGAPTSPSSTVSSPTLPRPTPAAPSAGAGPNGGSAVGPSSAPALGASPSPSAPRATPSPAAPSSSPAQAMPSPARSKTATASPTPSAMTSAVTASGPNAATSGLPGQGVSGTITSVPGSTGAAGTS